MQPQDGHPGGDPARLARMLCLYDNAGEHFQPGQDTASSPVTRHLARSQAILFLFDPTQDLRFRAVCRGGDAAGASQRAARLSRQETILNEAATRIRRHAGLSQNAKFDRPVIVVLSKLDVWAHLFDDGDEGEPWRSQGNLTGVDVERIERRSARFAKCYQVLPGDRRRRPGVRQGYHVHRRQLARTRGRGRWGFGVPDPPAEHPAEVGDGALALRDLTGPAGTGAAADLVAAELKRKTRRRHGYLAGWMDTVRRAPARGWPWPQTSVFFGDCTMSQELHYTSVPRGLKPGTRGFCTVAVTPQMSGPLVDRLENLSGYQPVYPAHDPAAVRNPVNFSHVRFSLAGRSLSILSRVGPAGLDYTGRANKYAHHVVLDATERPEGGPARLRVSRASCKRRGMVSPGCWRMGGRCPMATGRPASRQPGRPSPAMPAGRACWPRRS